MSRYLGRLVLEKEIIEGERISSVQVKYCVSSNRFLFKCFGCRTRFSLYADADLCWNLVQLSGDELDFQYVWSMGYAVRERNKDIRFLHNMEMDLLGKKCGVSDRKGLLLSERIGSDYEFDVLCAIQYKFKLCRSVLEDVVCQWKRKNWGRSKNRWVELVAKNEDWLSGGRKLGSKNIEHEHEEISKEFLDEELERVKHNKNVAVLRGYLGWWVDACKEECALLGVEFDKVACLDQWKNTRKDT